VRLDKFQFFCRITIVARFQFLFKLALFCQFRFERFILEQGEIQGVSLAAFQDYYGKRPFLERVEFHLSPSSTEALQAYQDGSVLGIGAVEAIPRRVLFLYDSEEEGADGTEDMAPYSSGHLLLAAPLEYFGITADYLDIQGPLPDYPLAGRYTGIVSWLYNKEDPRRTKLREWLKRQLDDGVRWVILNQPGVPLDNAMRCIAREGGGVVVVLRNHDTSREIIQRMREIQFQEKGETAESGNSSKHLRTFGVGAQILSAQERISNGERYYRFKINEKGRVRVIYLQPDGTRFKPGR